MRPPATYVARSVVCMSVCLSVCVCWLPPACCAKTIEMPFFARGRGGDSHGFKEPCITWRSRSDMNLFAAARVTSRRCGLLPNYFGHLFLSQQLPFSFCCMLSLFDHGAHSHTLTFLGRLLRVDLIKWVLNVRPSVHKKFLRFQ